MFKSSYSTISRYNKLFCSVIAFFTASYTASNIPSYNNKDTLTACGVVLDPKRYIVTVNDKPVELTKREFDLLYYMLLNKGVVVTRDMLMENVWDYDFDGGTNAVDVYIRFLRTKIDEAFDIKLIHTVRGVGYVIRDE